MRFSGFDDEWNEVTLNDVATFSKGKGISKNDISNYGIECVRYGELYTKYNEMIYNIESKTDLDKNELKLSEKNDILIPCSGETAIDLATASCIQKDQVAIGGDITVIKTNQYAPFITYYLNQKKTEIAKYAQGVSIVHLYPKDFKVMNIRIPSINEQKMIIRLLEEITKKEQLLESKYQQYQEFKKFLMQKIFAQELRFDNSSKIQKEIQLSDVISIINKRNKNDENIPVLSISNKFGFISQTEQFEDREVASSDKKNYKIVNKGEFAYNPARINVGSIAQLKNYEKGIISPMYIVFKVDSNVLNQTYFENFLDSDYFRYEMMKRLEGSVRMILSADSLKNIKITIPSIDEQEKLSKVFLAFDKKIKITKYQLDKTQEFKKGLLQQMFVVRINWRCNFKLAKSPSFNKHLLILKNKIIFIIIE